MRTGTAAWALVGFLLLAGCAGKDGGTTATATTTGSTTSATTAPPAEVRVNLTLLEVPTEANRSQPFRVVWGLNVTGSPSGTVNTTSIRWGNDSVAEPKAGTSYPSFSGVRRGVANGTYETTLTVNWTGTIRLRAHAAVLGEHFWSEEKEVVLKEGVPRVTKQITIGTLSSGPVANYDPNPAQVKVGEWVYWENEDSVGHTATAEDGTFDASVSASGKSSEYQMNEEGTFVYRCTIHLGMRGVLEVVEA